MDEYIAKGGRIGAGGSIAIKKGTSEDYNVVEEASAINTPKQTPITAQSERTANATSIKETYHTGEVNAGECTATCNYPDEDVELSQGWLDCEEVAESGENAGFKYTYPNGDTLEWIGVITDFTDNASGFSDTLGKNLVIVPNTKIVKTVAQ